MAQMTVVSFWLNVSMLNFLILNMVNVRVLIGMMVDSGWASTADQAHWKLKDVFKMMGMCFVPLYGTWIAVCSLRVWFLNNSELKQELKKRPFFVCFKTLAALK